MSDDDVKHKDIQQAERELVEIKENLGGSLEKLGKAKIERMRRSRARKAARRRMKKAKRFDKEIDEVIQLFVDGHMAAGAEAVAEIASLWKTAGLTKQSYLDLMEHIEQNVVKRTGFNHVRFQIHDALKAQAAKTRRIFQ